MVWIEDLYCFDLMFKSKRFYFLFQVRQKDKIAILLYIKIAKW